MLPDRVSNPGPLTYESGALPIALRGPAPVQSKGHDIYEDREVSNKICGCKILTLELVPEKK